MEEGTCNLLATAFMVGYALPTSITCQPSSPRPALSPPHTLSVRRACITKRRFRVKSSSLLTGFLEANFVLVDSKKMQELQWQLKSCRTIAHRFCGGRNAHEVVTLYPSSVTEGKYVKQELAGILSPMEVEIPAPSAKRLSGQWSDQVTQKVEKGVIPRQSRAGTHRINGLKTEQTRAKCNLHRSPDEIQSYMKMKNLLRSKEKKAAYVRTELEMTARKEKVKALEMERRARLRLEALNGKGRQESFSRPPWDSSLSASTDEVNGPWSNLSYPTAAVDFPLPKGVDADDFSSLGLAIKNNLESVCDSPETSENALDSLNVSCCMPVEGVWWHSESSQGNPNEENQNHLKVSLNKSYLYQEDFKESKLSTSKDRKFCSKHDMKIRSFSPVQCYKDGSKEMRLSLSVTRKGSKSRKQLQQHHAKAFVGGLKQSHRDSEKPFPKYIPKYTLFQQAYDTDGSITSSRCGDMVQMLPLQNKGKALTYSTKNQRSIAVERRHKITTRKSMMMDDLYQRVHPPSTTNIDSHMSDGLKDRLTCHTEYLTYHLEKFPAQNEREVLSEKKRVDLLKLLAQQLVRCLDAAETHPSYLLDGNVQAHAVLLRSNLEKFQRELHAAVKALEGSYSQGSREKSSGYIVLPSKLERIGSSERTLVKQLKCLHVEGPNSLQIKDAINKEAAFSSSSETTASATSVSFNSSSPRTAKKPKHYREPNREFAKHKNLSGSLVAYEERSNAIREPQMPDNMFQDFESRVQLFHTSSKCVPTNEGKHTWDHLLLNKELEKLDAEIRETKSRMARNLFLTHPPLADMTCVLSPLSNSPRCSDNATSLLEGDCSVSATLVNATTEEFVALPSLMKETDVSDAPNELKMASLDDKTCRESCGFASVTEISHVNEIDVKNDVILKTQECETMSTSHLVDNHNIDAELPLHAATSNITAPILSVETSFCVNTIPQSDSSMEATSVRKVEVSQVAPEPGGLTVYFTKEMDTNQKLLIDIITDTLMQELLDYELSGVVLHSRSSPIKSMKYDFLQSAKLEYAPISMDAHAHSDTSNSSCRLSSTSLVPAQEISNMCVMGLLNTSNDYESYHDFTTEKCLSGIPEIYRESFKHTSERLVDKYIEEKFEASGFLCSSNLLELYVSGKTLSLVLGKQGFDGVAREREEQLYGKVIMEALCECLDKRYLQFCLPSFFLFLQPCPEGPYLKKTLISIVNEHADAACEGGFSLEYILEKSLDEEDWKTPYHDMMEVLHSISEYVMVDMIDNFLHDVMELRHVAFASQFATGFMHSAKSEALCF